MNSTILMKTAIAFLLTLLVVIVPGYAQSQYLSADDSDREAVDLLTAAAKKFTEKPSQVRFVLKISYPGQEKMVSDGTLYQSGKAYHLDLKEYAIFSDGTTRWVYLKGPNEINIYNESNGQDWISPQDFLLLHTSDELVLTLIGERPDGITIIEAKPLEGRFDYYSKFTIGWITTGNEYFPGHLSGATRHAKTFFFSERKLSRRLCRRSQTGLISNAFKYTEKGKITLRQMIKKSLETAKT